MGRFVSSLFPRALRSNVACVVIVAAVLAWLPVYRVAHECSAHHHDAVATSHSQGCPPSDSQTPAAPARHDNCDLCHALQSARVGAAPTPPIAPVSTPAIVVPLVRAAVHRPVSTSRPDQLPATGPPAPLG
ncbi:MAG: hypothetical protein JNM80_02895 [Phycisphaerae bacterium]|nr:hypothetical protein [Phycisphaerae bacterium]